MSYFENRYTHRLKIVAFCTILICNNSKRHLYNVTCLLVMILTQIYVKERNLPSEKLDFFEFTKNFETG